MIPPETVQEIVNRIDIIDIVDNFVRLKRRGANYLGLCPFHHEKTPSFTVSPSKEIFKCFGCGKSGNAVTFLMEHEKLSYVEALKWLAAKYNVQIEEQEVSPEQRQQQQVSESLYIINHFARDFFVEQLWNSTEGQDIGLTYLQERGFTDEVLKKFEVGYNPQGGTALARAAVDAHYNRDLLLKAGLINDRQGQLLDNYRGRIIFPIHNQMGKVSGFGARLIAKNDRAPKYINTPENEIYVKSKILYGLWFARQEISKADECLLVEGYTDVVSLHMAGIENVVASGGTALTADQLRLIRKFSNNLTILYDGDSAGVQAALRGLNIALSEGLNVKLVLLPNNEDPDSFVKKEGTVAFREYILANKKDFILFQLDAALRDAGDDPQKRAEAVNMIADSLSRLNKTEDFTRQQDYVRKAADVLKIEEAGLHHLVNKLIRERLAKEARFQTDKSFAPPAQAQLPGVQSPEETEALELINTDLQHEKSLIRCLIEYGHLEWDETRTVADFLFSDFLDEEEFLKNPQMIEIAGQYKKLYLSGALHEKSFVYHENPQIASTVISLIDFPYTVSDKWEEKLEMKIARREDNYKSDVQSTILYFELKKIKKLLEENETELKSCRDFEEQIVLIQTHAHLKQMEIDLTKTLGTVILK